MQGPPKRAKAGRSAARFAFASLSLAAFVFFLFFVEPDAARLATSERLKPAPQIAVASFSLNGAATLKAAPGPIAPARCEPAAMGPKEKFLARCHVVERLDHPTTDGGWQRDLLMRDPGDGQLFRVEEKWVYSPENGSKRLLSRSIVSASQILIRVDPDAQRAEVQKMISRLALSLKLSRQIVPGVYQVELSQTDLGSVPRALDALRPHVLYAEADGIGFGAGSAPSDPYFSQQWNLANPDPSGADIGAVPFWDAVPSGEGVTIAVLDTGVDYAHPDLSALERRGFDFVHKDSDPVDDHGHGTGVAGVIFAARNNGFGTAGILPGAKLLAIKILKTIKAPDGSLEMRGLNSDLIAGLSYARANGASVVNLSLVEWDYSALVAEELARCESNNMIICVSAGNGSTDNDLKPDYPSSYTNANIIAVGGHDKFGARWSVVTNLPSNFGVTSVDVFAPGAYILSGGIAGQVLGWTGTSFAAPHVAATAAALRGLRPLWSVADIKTAILESAVRSPALAGLCQTGGRLDAARAADYALQRPPQRSQKIPAFAPIKDTPFRTTLILTNTTSSAGLPVSFSVVSGPARLSGNRLSVIGVGKVVLAARQPGNTEFNAAPALNTSFNAVKARQTIQFTLPSSRPFVRNGKLALNAASTAKLPVNYVSSNPRIIAITGKAPKAVAVIKGKGPVRITAAQRGNNNYLPAKSVSRTIDIK